jgi:hypothetical protein
LFEAPGRETRESEEEKRKHKALEGSAQLQAGAGNEIGPKTEFQEVTGIDFIELLPCVAALFYLLV